MANLKALSIAAASAGLALFTLAPPVFAGSGAGSGAGPGEVQTAAHSQSSQHARSGQSANFVRFNKKLGGDVTVLEVDGRTVLRFGESFRASRGPDLKVFLSPQGLDTVSGRTAVDGAVRLGELKRNRGTQDYVLPEGVNLSEFSSVLVHCEEFSVLWGGAELF